MDELFVSDAFTASNATAFSEGEVIVTLTGSGTIGAWRAVAEDHAAVHAARAEILSYHSAPPGVVGLPDSAASASGAAASAASARHAREPSHGAASAAAWPDETIVIVFAGGYGGAPYTQGLSLFCEAAKALRGTRFGFVFSPHPGYPSSYEAGLFKEWGCLEDAGTGNMRVVHQDTWKTCVGAPRSPGNCPAARARARRCRWHCLCLCR